MNNSNITVTLNDACCNKKCNRIYERTLNDFTITNYSNLQNGYAFTVLNITATTATVVIQNGIFYYIRTIPLCQSIPFCLPCQSGGKHIVTITVNAINVI